MLKTHVLAASEDERVVVGNVGGCLRTERELDPWRWNFPSKGAGLHR